LIGGTNFYRAELAEQIAPAREQLLLDDVHEARD
jgi:hypothetical protein